MPLLLPGSIVIGPRATGSSTPATLPAYLASIGKASWYGGFRAGLLMFDSPGNSLTPVTINNSSVGHIEPSWTAGGFTSFFWQLFSSKRPVYGTNRNGKPGIYGSGVDYYFDASVLDFNRTYTFLCSAWTPQDGTARLFSHNLMHELQNGTATSSERLFIAGIDNNQNNKVILNTPTGAGSTAIKFGLTTSGTGHYGTAPRLFSRSNGSGFTSGTLHEWWFVPALTPAEIAVALSYLI